MRLTFLSGSARRDRNPAVRITAVKLLGEMGPSAKSTLSLLASLQKLPKTASEQDKALAKAAEAADKIQAK